MAIDQAEKVPILLSFHEKTYEKCAWQAALLGVWGDLGWAGCCRWRRMMPPSTPRCCRNPSLEPRPVPGQGLEHEVWARALCGAHGAVSCRLRRFPGAGAPVPGGYHRHLPEDGGWHGRVHRQGGGACCVAMGEGKECVLEREASWSRYTSPSSVAPWHPGTRWRQSRITTSTATMSPGWWASVCPTSLPAQVMRRGFVKDTRQPQCGMYECPKCWASS